MYILPIYGSRKIGYNMAIMEKVPEYFGLQGGDNMPVSKAQQKAVHKYVRANYDRLELTVPKGRKDEIKAHAAARGESVNAFITRAIDQTMERDNEEGGVFHE